MSKTYSIGEVEYELYEAASGDWCVSVSRYGKDREDFNMNTKEAALEFILSDSEVD